MARALEFGTQRKHAPDTAAAAAALKHKRIHMAVQAPLGPLAPEQATYHRMPV